MSNPRSIQIKTKYFEINLRCGVQILKQAVFISKQIVLIHEAATYGHFRYYNMHIFRVMYKKRLS